MENAKINEDIRKKIKDLMNAMGVKKMRIGEALADFPTGEKKQKTFLRAQRFLEGPSPIKIQALNKVARLLQKPLLYFLSETDETIFQLNAPEKNSQKKSSEKEASEALNEIQKNLEKLEFSKAFIAEQMKTLKAKK